MNLIISQLIKDSLLCLQKTQLLYDLKPIVEKVIKIYSLKVSEMNVKSLQKFDD